VCVQEPCVYLLWPPSVVIGNNVVLLSGTYRSPSQTILKYSIGYKKSDTTKNVRFFSNFSWWFKMLPSLFELLNQLHKRPVQLVKGIKKATRAHRPLSKDLNLSKKNGFFWVGKLPIKITGKVSKRIPLRKSMA
jgi:hypothetical protein